MSAPGGPEVGRAYVTVNADTTDLNRQIREALQRIANDESHLSDKQKEEWAKRRRANLEYWDDRTATAEAGLQKELLAERNAMRRREQDTRQGLDRMRTAIRGLRRSWASNLDEMETNERGTFRRLVNDFETHARQLSRGFGAALGGNTRGLSGVIGKLADGMGQLFTTVIVGAAKAGAALFDFGVAVGKMFTGDFAAMKEQLAKIGGGLASFALSIPGLVAGIGAMLVVLGLLAAVVSTLVPLVVGLAGALVAVGSAIGFGLIGVLGAALPLVAALAAVLGTLFLGLKGKKKALQEALAPLKEIRVDVSQTLLGGINDAAKTLVANKPLFESIATGAENMAKAISDSMKSIVATFTAPAVVAALDKLGNGDTGLPALSRSLANSTGQFAAGMLNVLTVLLPVAQKLGDAIEGMATTFNQWTSNPENQKKLGSFFDKAWATATLLWDILVQVGIALAGIAGVAWPTGDSMLQGLLDWFTKAADWVKSEQGQNSLKGWFQQAKDLMKPLGDALGGIVEALGKLNTPENQKRLDSFLTWIGDVTPKVADFINKLSDLGDKVFKVIGLLEPVFRHMFAPISATLDILTGNFSGAWTTIYNYFVQPFLDLGSTIGGAVAEWAPLAGRAVANVAVAIGNSIAGIAESIAHSIAGIAVSIAHGVAGIATTVWDAIVGAFDSVIGWITGTLFPFFEELPGKIIGFLLDFGPKLLKWIVEAWVGVNVWLAEFIAIELIPFILLLPLRIVTALAGLVRLLIEWAAETWPKVLAWISDWVTGTFLPWLLQLPGWIVQQLLSLAGDLVAWATDAWTSMYNWLVDWVTGTLLPWLVDLPGLLISAVITLAADLVTWATDAWTSMYSWVTDWVTGTFLPWLHDLPGVLINAVINFATDLVTWATEAWTGMYSWLIGWVTGTFLPWLAGLPNQIIDWLGDLASLLLDWGRGAFEDMLNGIQHWMTDTFIPWLGGIPEEIFNAIGSWSADMIAKLVHKFAGPFEDAYNEAKKWVDLIGSLNPFGNTKLPDNVAAAAAAAAEGKMTGGMINRPMFSMLGEHGLREAVIPLQLPLSRVDPSVRAMAELVRYGTGPMASRSQYVGTPQRAYNYDVRVEARSADADAVASAVFNRLAALSR